MSDKPFEEVLQSVLKRLKANNNPAIAPLIAEIQAALHPYRSRLRPCPFCGNEDDLELKTGSSALTCYGIAHAVICNQCEAQGPYSTISEEKAISYWNENSHR